MARMAASAAPSTYRESRVSRSVMAAQQSGEAGAERAGQDVPVARQPQQGGQCAGDGAEPWQDVAAATIQPDHRGGEDAGDQRSEEHTSELQSLMRISYAVFCLKKKNITERKSTQAAYSAVHTKHK